ncbi:phytanoyl-CoA dioxygenase family protein [Paenibacillus gansuensis]|uniref:Phytanoyl-CoA dioxygenase family protein n=1 Tax=Paenibacillus gansuensis TaxID=306542 RepID=A0ABW5PC94_9BACL
MNVLSKETVEAYREYGFVQIDDVLTPEEVRELASYMEEAMVQKNEHAVNQDAPGGSYYRVLNQKVNVWRDHGGMAQFSFHSKLARMALELTGAEGIRLFHDHALWKMPQDSKPTPWHQDFPYWPMNEPGALSIWIPVDDVDENNGCMMFVPESQKKGKLTGIDFLNPQDLFEIADMKDMEKDKPVKVPLKAGSCTFHNGLTFHYAHANLTDRPRRVLAIIYMPDGTTYSGQPHQMTNDIGLVVGEPIKGPLFPLLAKK